MAITNLQDSEGGEEYEAEIAAKNQRDRSVIQSLWGILQDIPGSDVLVKYHTRVSEDAPKERTNRELEFYSIIWYLVAQDKITLDPGLLENKVLTKDKKEHIEECFLALGKLLEKKEFPILEDITKQWFKDRCMEYGFDESTASLISLNKPNMRLPGKLIKERYLAPLRELVDLNQKTLDLIIEMGHNEDKNSNRLNSNPLVMINILRTIAQKTDLRNADFDKIKELYALAHSSEQMDSYIDLHIQNPSAPIEAIRNMYLFTNQHRSPGYVLKTHIASGSQKHVFEAEDPECPEDRAVIKIFNLKEIEEYMKKRGEIPNFNEKYNIIGHEKKAARISRDSKNQNISMVRTIQSLDDKGTYYMIEDWFEETLEDCIERNNKESTRIKRPDIVLRAICNGLKTFHNNGLAHGDLKASNIGLIYEKEESQIRHSNQVKITDCGYATSFKYNPKDKTFSLTGLSVRAPELYTTNEDRLVQPTPKSDIWAIGVLAYYMFTGEYPFLRPSKEEREKNWREIERMVLQNIKYALRNSRNSHERLFNKRAFKNPRKRKFIVDCLQLDPEKRADVDRLINRTQSKHFNH